jgi:Zn-dependent peptidase ImmA (M78 family)
LSVEGKKGTTVRKILGWEAELWSYLSQGDGVHCPIHQSCHLRLQGGWCLSEHEEYYQLMNNFLDDEAPDLTDPAGIKFEFRACPHSGRIFKLVRRLAVKYQMEAGIDRLPVSADLIIQAADNLPIEVRRIPLQAYHGSIWRLSDCWLVQLNSNDTPARQRFTLYHEIFHVLAHCKANPVLFKKTACSREGSFNELLADHFAAIILMPENLVRKKWAEVKDVSQMAAIFDVPQPIVWFALKHLSLI